MTDQVAEVLRRPACRLVRFQRGDSLLVPWMLFRLFPLHQGEPVDVADYREKLASQQNRFALEQAVRLLEVKDRSQMEIQRKLTAQGYSPHSIRLAIEKLKTTGYLNDSRFAQNTLERLGKKYGPLRLKQELMHKGIDEAQIEEALMEQGPEAYLQTAITWAKKAHKRQKESDPKVMYRKLYATLARRGYPPETVKKALAAVLAAQEDLEE